MKISDKIVSVGITRTTIFLRVLKNVCDVWGAPPPPYHSNDKYIILLSLQLLTNTMSKTLNLLSDTKPIRLSVHKCIGCHWINSTDQYIQLTTYQLVQCKHMRSHFLWITCYVLTNLACKTNTYLAAIFDQCWRQRSIIMIEISPWHYTTSNDFGGRWWWFDKTLLCLDWKMYVFFRSSQ